MTCKRGVAHSAPFTDAEMLDGRAAVAACRKYAQKNDRSCMEKQDDIVQSMALAYRRLSTLDWQASIPTVGLVDTLKAIPEVRCS